MDKVENFNNEQREAYGEKYQDHLLEQYKLYIEMAATQIAGNAHMNRYNLTLHSMLFTLIGYILQKNSAHLTPMVWVIVGVGLIMALIWCKMFFVYKRLARGKRDVVREFEKRLPFPPWTVEWDKEGKIGIIHWWFCFPMVPIILYTFIITLGLFGVFATTAPATP
jgi:hypothetical protein